MFFIADIRLNRGNILKLAAASSVFFISPVIITPGFPFQPIIWHFETNAHSARY
jgi:hypothetical protein